MSDPNKAEEREPVGSSELLACPWCGEPDYDLVGLKSHVIKGECEQFEAISVIRSPFDVLTARQANDGVQRPAR